MLLILFQQRASDIPNAPFFLKRTRLTVLFHSPSCGEDTAFLVFFVPISSKKKKKKKTSLLQHAKKTVTFVLSTQLNSLIVWEVRECSLVVLHKHAGRIRRNRHKHMRDDRLACVKCAVLASLMTTPFFSGATCRKATFKYSFGHARVLVFISLHRLNLSTQRVTLTCCRSAKLSIVAYLLRRAHSSAFSYGLLTRLPCMTPRVLYAKGEDGPT